jgi:hypothetical protein
MRLLAYDREARYRAADLAAHDLMRCRDIPRDGRGDLARLLDDRFPRSRRQQPNSRPPGLSTPSEVRTVTEPSVPIGAPPWPRLGQREDGQHLVVMLERARRRRRTIAWGVLLAVLSAAVIAMLMAR